jgi:hypothetical protein
VDPLPPNGDRKPPPPLDYERPSPVGRKSIYPHIRDWRDTFSTPGWVLGYPLLLMFGLVSCAPSQHPPNERVILLTWLLFCSGFALSLTSIFSRRRRKAALAYVLIYAIPTLAAVYNAWPYFVRKYFE